MTKLFDKGKKKEEKIGKDYLIYHEFNKELNLNEIDLSNKPKKIEKIGIRKVKRNTK